MTEPLLLVEPMDNKELRIHSYPRFLWFWCGILATILLLLYISHWNVLDNTILDLHTVSWSIIISQMSIILLLLGVPYSICLWKCRVDSPALTAAERADIDESQIFMKYLLNIYTYCAAIVLFIDLLRHIPFQSILFAFFCILVLLYTWHRLCKMILYRRGHAVDSTIVNLVEYANKMKQEQDSITASPAETDRIIR